MNSSVLTFGAGDDQFVFSGFSGTNLTLDDMATITPDGLLELTNGTSNLKGHAFFPVPVSFRGLPQPELPWLGICHRTEQRPIHRAGGAVLGQLGLTNIDDDGNASNHIFAAEIDTIQNIEFQDIDNNHVGVDINGLHSLESHPAGYYDKDGIFHAMDLISGRVMQAWVDYGGDDAQINVTIAPIGMSKPVKPLVSATCNLKDVLMEPSFVGFSSTCNKSSTTSN
ncbi:hypothetical protein GUJ93_ZPchr0005g15683 [Zizania palustris]|uniref:Legume lectin domain-containing protein n=1 Tax=Zizania palustris TaxID=103762 RepID=A0A8J5VCX8_ZIZPA|nr:hypothetical protein GUJ93_ZPchr0005g15683 [Zizania palustris]